MPIRKCGCVFSGNKFRFADKSEAELLSTIHRSAFPNYWDVESFNNFFAVANTFALVVGEVAMIVYRIQYDQADIITLAVLPEARRQGLGRLLTQKAMEHLAALGAEKLFLDVEVNNTPAISLYEGLGFKELRRRKNYYRGKDGTYTDALVMKRKLG